MQDIEIPESRNAKMLKDQNAEMLMQLFSTMPSDLFRSPLKPTAVTSLAGIIENGVMTWNALRQNDDGTMQTVVFEMTKVE